MHVTKNSEYEQWVPILLGTLQIDRIWDLVYGKEILQLNIKWIRDKIALLLMGKMAQIRNETEKDSLLIELKEQ